MVFAMGMDMLLYRNISGNIHIAWSLITQHLRMCTNFGGRLVPALELIGNMFNRSEMTMFSCSTEKPSLEIMHLVWNTVNGFRQIWICFRTFYSQMKLHSPVMA
jgi:hypothetical protein